LWSDSQINIHWPQLNHLKLSAKDQAGLSLSAAEVFE